MNLLTAFVGISDHQAAANRVEVEVDAEGFLVEVAVRLAASQRGMVVLDRRCTPWLVPVHER